MTADVIIPCLNRFDLTMACLASLGVTPLIIDNGSTDETRLMAVAQRNPVNVGFAAACNQGAAISTADVLVFLNNDTVCHEGWLGALLAPFADPAVGITGARLTYPSGAIQHAGVTVDFTRPHGCEAQNIRLDLAVGDYDVAAVTGACLAIRHDLFTDVGGFDVGYWNGYEDVDLCLKAAAFGYRIRYASQAHVTHLESQSGHERWSAVTANIDRLRAKWMSA